MKLTENKLRTIIREVIQETGVTRRKFLQNIGSGAVAVLASKVFSVHARPLKDRLEIDSHVREVLRDLPFNQNLHILVRRAIISVDEMKVNDLKNKVLNPWIEECVKPSYRVESNFKYGSLKHSVNIRLGEDLKRMLREFKASRHTSKRSISDMEPGYTESRQSSLTKSQMEKYRADQERMRSALKDN
tara:strand:- start:3724 stop:4287 length:564 start_codon:yes stop_codon:yes gene_type:complete